jgi:hypothetical protein
MEMKPKILSAQLPPSFVNAVGLVSRYSYNKSMGYQTLNNDKWDDASSRNTYTGGGCECRESTSRGIGIEEICDKRDLLLISMGALQSFVQNTYDNGEAAPNEYYRANNRTEVTDFWVGRPSNPK